VPNFSGKTPFKLTLSQAHGLSFSKNFAYIYNFFILIYIKQIMKIKNLRADVEVFCMDIFTERDPVVLDGLVEPAGQPQLRLLGDVRAAHYQPDSEHIAQLSVGF
jgi:hypothetical protein